MNDCRFKMLYLKNIWEINMKIRFGPFPLYPGHFWRPHMPRQMVIAANKNHSWIFGLVLKSPNTMHHSNYIYTRKYCDGDLETLYILI